MLSSGQAARSWCGMQSAIHAPVRTCRCRCEAEMLHLEQAHCPRHSPFFLRVELARSRSLMLPADTLGRHYRSYLIELSSRRQGELLLGWARVSTVCTYAVPRYFLPCTAIAKTENNMAGRKSAAWGSRDGVAIWQRRLSSCCMHATARRMHA